MRKLSEAQSRVFDAITSHCHRTTVPITQKMINTQTGLTIPRIRECLDVLKKEGLIEWRPSYPNSIKPRQVVTVQGDARTLSALRTTAQALRMIYKMILRLELEYKIPIDVDDSKRLAHAHEVMKRAHQLLTINGVEING